VLKARKYRRVIVTLKSGQAFAGLLYEHDRDALVLRDVKTVDRGGDHIPVDGEVVLLLDEVDYLQVP
jgi:small nuclear ribonucleoprotein (snRNP)-like protein